MASIVAGSRRIAEEFERDRRAERRSPMPQSRSDLPALRSPLALASLIEAEIIPRMLLAHRHDAAPAAPQSWEAPPPAAATGDAIVPEEAARFADLVLHQEAYALIERIERHLAAGVSIDSILLDLLAPAARTLGRAWEDDRCDFVDVTMGLWRLQEIVHELAARLPGIGPVPGQDRRALFAAMPGDQHSFGMVMVEEFFRRGGWSTWSLPTGSCDDLYQLVRRQPFELVGLTVSYDGHLDRVAGVIEGVRSASRQPGISVMVGGRVFVERPELALLCGADGTAPDARQAVGRAEILLEMRAFHDTSRC